LFYSAYSDVRQAKLPEGADGKGVLHGKTLAKNKTFDSSMSPSGQLERLVRKSLIEFIVRNKKVLISPNGSGYPYESTKNHIAGVMGCYKYPACPDQYGDRDENSGEPLV
jgi:hypothetical protein